MVVAVLPGCVPEIKLVSADFRKDLVKIRHPPRNPFGNFDYVCPGKFFKYFYINVTHEINRAVLV